MCGCSGGGHTGGGGLEVPTHLEAVCLHIHDLQRPQEKGAGGEGELDIYFIQECILYVPWPMPLRVSDFHFPNSNFHSLALALAPIVHGNTVVDTFPSPTPSPSPGT